MRQITYESKIDIPHLDIKAGDIITEVDGVWATQTGAAIPEYVDLGNRNCFDIKIVYMSKHPVGTVVRDMKTTLAPLIVIGYDSKNDLYTCAPYNLLTLKIDDKAKRLYKDDELMPITPYYFINSKGVVCYSIEGIDKRADRWRRFMGNFWYSKGEADEAREKLIQEFEKQEL